MDSELFIEIYWVFPRLPLGIVAYAFTPFLDNFCQNSCIQLSWIGRSDERKDGQGT